MLSLASAVARVLNNTVVLPSERVMLRRAAGRILASTVRAPFDVPRFDFSSVDGFALRASDVRLASRAHPVSLTITGTIRAGDRKGVPLPRGRCVRIMTGAPIPAGADAIVMKEDVVDKGRKAMFRSAATIGMNVRPRGAEFRRNQVVLPSGARLSPPAIGLLSALGISKLSVTRSPRIAVITTGNELVPAGEALGPSKIYDANTPAIVAALEAIGITPTFTRVIPDERRLLAATLRRALRSVDVVVTIGGVSVGDADLVREVSRAEGVRQIFWRVALKPGKPNFVGRKGSVLLFGLPGNPVSALVSFRVILLPALRKMLRGSANHFPTLKARLDGVLKSSPDRLQLVRGLLLLRRGDLRVVPLRGQDSHMLGALARANCLIRVQRGRRALQRGALVDVDLLDWRLT